MSECFHCKIRIFSEDDELEIEELKKQNETMKEALKFYANEFNWTTHQEDLLCRLDLVIRNDKESYGELNDDNESVLVCTGGKRARQALKDIE